MDELNVHCSLSRIRGRRVNALFCLCIHLVHGMTLIPDMLAAGCVGRAPAVQWLKVRGTNVVEIHDAHALPVSCSDLLSSSVKK